MSRPDPAPTPRNGRANPTDLRDVQVRTLTFAAVLLLVLALLMVRLAKRQVVEAGEWRQKAAAQQTPIRSVSAYRGDIRTRDGKVLARSVRTRSAFAEPRRFGKRTRTKRGLIIEPATSADRLQQAQAIGEALGYDARQIRDLAARFENPRRQAFCWIERRLSDAESLALEQARVRGVGFQTEYRRTYPCGTLAAHVLGFTGLEASGSLTGQSGVERGFDAYLKGIDGRREVVRDGQGGALLTEGNLLLAPVDGAIVTTTIDSRVQAIAERAAKKGAEEWKPEGIAVVCLEPQTGRILALASWPSFDPNDLNALTADPAFREVEAQRLFGRSDNSLTDEERTAVTKAVLERVTRNRPLMDPYEPGSTLKPIIAASGVDIGAIRPDERIDCAGPFRVAGKAVTDVHPHGTLRLRGVISKSSNVGMVKIALRMGAEAVRAALVRSGFAEPTGIGLAVEERGRIPDLANWKTFTTRSVAQGYALLVTPLQLASAFAALGTGGVRYTPQLIETIATPEGQLVRRFRRKVASRIVDEQTARDVIVPALEEVVNDGTAKKVRLEEWQVAGKTGTAMKVINGRYANRYRSSFVGFAPSRDPRLLVLVMVDDPRSPDGRRPYGGTVAGPIAKEIFAESLPYLLR